MPGYSEKAQPFLNAIAASMFSSQVVRNWAVQCTPFEESYFGSEALVEEPRHARWKRKKTVQPFWANYWCGRDALCTCRENGTGIETDAIFFLRNSARRVLALHLEFKHARERFGLGQREAYSRRARCFQETYASRPSLIPHDDWTTILICDEQSATEETRSFFHRVITHSQAAGMIKDYPAA